MNRSDKFLTIIKHHKEVDTIILLEVEEVVILKRKGKRVCILFPSY